MNLNIYDDVVEKVNKRTTWIDVKRHILISREFNVKPYYVLAKRYNTTIQCNEYYIIFLDNPPVDRDYNKTKVDDYGRCKISLRPIWGLLDLNSSTKDFNVSVYHIETDDTSSVYQIDV